MWGNFQHVVIGVGGQEMIHGVEKLSGPASSLNMARLLYEGEAGFGFGFGADLSRALSSHCAGAWSSWPTASTGNW